MTLRCGDVLTVSKSCSRSASLSTNEAGIADGPPFPSSASTEARPRRAALPPPAAENAEPNLGDAPATAAQRQSYRKST
jgi:hypothetical protein